MAGFGLPKSFNFAGLAGDPVFFDAQAMSTPGSPKTILTIVVGAGVSFNLVQLLGTGQFSGIFRVFKDADLIGSARVRPGNPNIFLNWFPNRPIASGETIKVEFEQRPQTPSVSVDVNLMVTQPT